MAKRPAAAAKPAAARSAVPSAEIGVSGLKVHSGFVDEEFLADLRSTKGQKTLREMADNDATVGGILFAISLMIRAVKWKAEPAKDEGQEEATPEAEAEAQFVESLFNDTSHSWEDFIQEVLTMLVFGWAYHEIVLKLRIGPLENDPAKRSKYTDGRVGIRKLAPRSQDSLLRWEMQDDGGIAGMWQQPPTGGQTVFIPIERALLFRTTSRKNNPEGVSVLRTAYRAWYMLSRIQNVEAIGIERELAGLPLVKIPARYLTSTAPADAAVLARYEQIARDLKFNAQGGLVIPSDPYVTKDGVPTNIPQVDVSLLSAGGPRAIDTGTTKRGYQQDIARSVLADFIMLGTDSKGSFALSDNKTSMFLRACKAINDSIAAVINRHLLPRIWNYNALDPVLMPTYVPGSIDVTDLIELGDFVSKLAAAGADLFPDQELENHMRREAGLPEKSQEAIEEQEKRRQEGMPAGDDEPSPGKPVGKMEPQTLYVRRDVLNVKDFQRWAKSQGISAIVEDPHVTITYSRRPVDWMKMGEPWNTKVEVAEGGPRALSLFGMERNILVLEFVCRDVTFRHEDMVERGCSFDWPEFKPHITITTQAEGLDLSTIEPYRGKIVLGPEIFEPVKEDWRAAVKETAT